MGSRTRLAPCSAFLYRSVGLSEIDVSPCSSGIPFQVALVLTLVGVHLLHHPGLLVVCSTRGHLILLSLSVLQDVAALLITRELGIPTLGCTIRSVRGLVILSSRYLFHSFCCCPLSLFNHLCILLRFLIPLGLIFSITLHSRDLSVCRVTLSNDVGRWGWRKLRQAVRVPA